VPRYDLGKPPDENTPSKHETNMQVKRQAWIVCHNPSWSRKPHLYAVTRLTCINNPTVTNYSCRIRP